MNRFIILIVCCTVLLIVASSPPHPFYVSVTDVFYNEEEQAAEITIRMFTDDIELAIESQGTGRLHMGTERQLKELETYLERYVKKHVAISSGDEKLMFAYLGQEVEIEHTWCYLEITKLDPPTQLSIRNSLMMDVHDGQRNIVHVKIGEQIESLLLEKGSVSGTVVFD